MKIGIPRALMYYRYGTLWETFFHELGAETVLSPETNKQIMDAGDRYAIDENCLSTKLFFGHVAALEHLCDTVFIPRLASTKNAGLFCTRFEGLYDTSMAVFRDRDLLFLTCNVDPIQNSPAEKAYTQLGMSLGASKQEALAAYKKGLAAQKNALERRIAEQDALFHTGDTRILVVGHGYNLHDEYIGAPIVRTIASLGVIPLLSDAVDPRVARAKSTQLCEHVPWTVNRELLGSVVHYRDRIDGIVLVTAFPCGPDSMTNEMIIRRVRDLPVLTLIMDAQSGIAGVETRLESFIDIIRFRKGVRV